MGIIKVALIGAGNCASSLVQGLYKYAEVDSSSQRIPGVMHNSLGGYSIGDIQIVAAFDVDEEKVGRDISEALFASNNNAIRFHNIPETGVKVKRGPVMDGIGEYLSEVVETKKDENSAHEDVESALREADVVVNYLPVGSQKATEWYAEQALNAGCAFVNCIPVFIASNPKWVKRFEERGIPIIGDDIKSQVGATIVHRSLVRLFEDRGIRLDKTYQLNFGGNTDFLNMLERRRLKFKKISKTNAVKSQLEREIGTDNIHIGPSDWVPWLEDRKWAYIRMEGTAWGNVPINVELKLEVEDSPNSAGIVVDTIRCAKIALDRGMKGSVEAPSAYFMKSPSVQYTDDNARRMLEEFISPHLG